MSYARQMRAMCAPSARRVRVNLVPESKRQLQMAHTRQVCVICASSAREFCAGICVSFINDGYAKTASGYA